MKKLNKTEKIAFKKLHPAPSIKYWSAIHNGKQIDSNNSIALLRHKYGNSVIYKAIR